MNKINVSCQVKTYDPELTDNHLIVQSAPAFEGEVTLIFGDEKVTVYGRDLMTAIENCMNT